MCSEKNIIVTEKKLSVSSRIFAALGTAVLLLLLFRIISPFVFYNNDDLYRKMIVSGEISGSPSPYLIYGHYLSGLFLSLLYRLAPAAPWYGMFSCGCIALAMSAVCYRLTQRCRRLRSALGVCVLFSLFAPFFFYRHLALLQYTVLAAIMGGCAVFWAMTMDLSPSLPARRGLGSRIVLYVLAALTLSIRDQVFFLMLPFAGLLWIGRFLTDNAAGFRERVYRYTRPMAALLILIALLMGIQSFAYSSPSWKAFLSFVDDSVTLYDYNGFPDYEENKTLYEELGVTEASLEAIASRYMLLNNPDASAESFAALAERSVRLQEKPFSVSGLLSLWKESLTSYTDRALRPINLLILLLYMGFFLLAGLKRQWKQLLLPALLFAARSALWIYILYQGRCPERISWTLLLTELFSLMGLVFALNAVPARSDSAGTFPVKALRGIPVLLLLCGLALCLRSSDVLAETAARAKGSLAFSKNYEELKAYCNRRADAHFLVDLYAAAYYTEDMLSFRTVRNENMLSLGSWLTLSPLTDRRLASWGIENAGTALLDDPGLYVIFADTEDFPPDYFFRYYEEKYPGCSFTLTDTLQGSQGINFLIYKGAHPSAG